MKELPPRACAAMGRGRRMKKRNSSFPVPLFTFPVPLFSTWEIINMQLFAPVQTGKQVAHTSPEEMMGREFPYPFPGLQGDGSLSLLSSVFPQSSDGSRFTIPAVSCSDLQRNCF